MCAEIEFLFRSEIVSFTLYLSLFRNIVLMSYGVGEPLVESDCQSSLYTRMREYGVFNFDYNLVISKWLCVVRSSLLEQTVVWFCGHYEIPPHG